MKDLIMHIPKYIRIYMLKLPMGTCILSVKTEKKKNKRSQSGKESTDMKNNSSKGTHIRVPVYVL